MTARQPLPVRGTTDTGTRRNGETGSGRLVGTRDSSWAPAAEDPRDAAPPGGAASPCPPVPESAESDDAGDPRLWHALRDVMDPEFPISIVDLGLVYGIRRHGHGVEVDLTFTATACPCMDFIREDVRERLLREPGVGEVVIREVWSPPWTRERITPGGRAVLRSHGVAA